MEDETTAYWCHTCSQTVTPVREADIKCPFCQSGFLEEMQQEQEEQQQRRYTNVWRPDIPVWASLLMEMTNNSSARNQTVESPENVTDHRGGGGGDYMESQLQEMLRRRGRRPVSVAQLLQGTRAGLTLAPAAQTNNADPDHDDADRERGRVIVTNPYNQIVAVPSSAVSDSLPPLVPGSLSEYFIGPEFETFLESLTETDPSRYGTPPARRDTVEALASVKIQGEGLQCSVCLDDFEVGTLGKQMPCKHSFHPHCLLPWLELHSSCPVCRCQLPTAEEDETKTNGSNGGGGGSASTSSNQRSENSDPEEDPMAA
ncbi:unnamed protein product [Eruca vesicaria subsp. sativa]|uniref:RING-type E3 ubiquitin transferase n=1 Tax=Eruca vesicaria subsp. sativa TaxID=29727 RepID=A0ABC8J6S0_ERUVS|nr:unnamed protein product [Eruca vesicaria subsp. sativa]